MKPENNEKNKNIKEEEEEDGEEVKRLIGNTEVILLNSDQCNFTLLA